MSRFTPSTYIFIIIIFCNLLFFAYFFINYSSFSNHSSLNGYASSGANIAIVIETNASGGSNPRPTCGDITLQAGEQCDDGNIQAGDGCSTSCTIESGWTCDTASPSFCTFVGTGSGSGSGSSGSGGGGGGGGGYGGASVGVGEIVAGPNFITTVSEITLRMVTGSTESRRVTLKNTGNAPLPISVFSEGITPYLILPSDSVYIDSGKSEQYLFSVHAPLPGIYAGKLIFQYQGIIREVRLILNILSQSNLFDASFVIPEKYRVLGKGDSFKSLIDITDISGKDATQATAYYVIKDFNGKELYREKESLVVNGALHFDRKFNTNNIGPGDYVAGIEVVYPGGFATASAPFRVSSTKLSFNTLVALIIAIIVFFMLIIYFLIKNRKNKNNKLLKRVSTSR